MAKQLVEFQTGEGKSVFVELEVTEDGSGLAGVDGVVARAKDSFDEAIQMIRPIADVVVQNLSNLASAPDQVNVEFGVKLSAKAGIIIASTDAEANLKVSLTWTRKQSVS